MKIDMILGLIGFIVVLALELLVNKMNIPFMNWLKNREQQMGSKIVAAFLIGFVLFTLFTDRMPQAGQKIPVAIIALLLLWANLFLGHKTQE